MSCARFPICLSMYKIQALISKFLKFPKHLKFFGKPVIFRQADFSLFPNQMALLTYKERAEFFLVIDAWSHSQIGIAVLAISGSSEQHNHTTAPCASTVNHKFSIQLVGVH